MNARVKLPPTFEPCEVGRVEDVLAQRWHAPRPVDAPPLIHSCSLNLVTYVEDAEAAETVSKDVGVLADVHPIRAITIVEDEKADEQLVRAWVGADCTPSDGTMICSEEISLVVHPESVGLIVASLQGLLAADLPVYFWWRGGTPSGNALFLALAKVADKIIVDSVRFGDGAAALDSVRRILDLPGKAGVADLNWERTAPWREAVAACFADPVVAGLLAHFTRASIDYSTDGTEGVRPSARALLLATWLASRDRRVRGRVRIKPEPSDVGAGRVLKLSLSSPTSAASLELRRRGGPIGIESVAKDESGAAIRRWSFPAATLREEELLHRCIDAPARDPLLEAALRSE